MARWLVGLEGERFDIEEFPYWFPSGEVHAVQLDEEVFLAGHRFEQLSEATKVYEAAQAAFDELFAVISLFQSNLVRPQISSVIREQDDGSRDTVMPVSAVVRARSKASGAVGLVGENEKYSAGTKAQALLEGLGVDASLDMAMSLWADPERTWPRLYRILEEIEQYLGMKVTEAGLCSKNQRSSFTRSANDPTIAGRHARHAVEWEPPKDPMNLQQAQSFISKLLKMSLTRAASEGGIRP